MKTNRLLMTNEQRRAWTGWIFISPWIVGFLLFFAKPLIQSFWYAFQNITIGDKGYILEFIKLDNFIYAFTKDPDYVRNLVDCIKNLFYEVPIIVLFSLFIAVILNQKFKGRMMARAVFFLPVIITSGIIIAILKEDIFARAIQQGNAQSAFMFKSSGLLEILTNTGLDYRIVNYFSIVVNKIFDMSWKSGVQILLFLAGLQTIPVSAYEAADVEGASAWETFWKITFPLISPVILVNIIYSVIDSFTDYGNSVMRMIQGVAFGQMRYGYSSALAWVFFLSVFLVIGLVNLVISRKVFYMVD